MTTNDDTDLTGERADLIETLTKHRALFLRTVEGVDEDQARTRTTVSALTLGGLVKHVSQVEGQWADFIVDGPAPTPDIDFASVDWTNPPPEVQAFMDSHRLLEEETLAGVVAGYAEVAARTDDLIRSADLDLRHPLPEAPWFEPGVTWSVRRVVVHILAETSQHAGHADIIREGIDGQKTMG